jgi:hypothetical protein
MRPSFQKQSACPAEGLGALKDDGRFSETQNLKSAGSGASNLDSRTNSDPSEIPVRTDVHPRLNDTFGQAGGNPDEERIGTTNKEQIIHITEPSNSTSNYWLNCILLPNRHERDAFLEYTNKQGIMTRPVWELMNRLHMFKNAQYSHLSNAEWIADRLVNISSSVIV